MLESKLQFENCGLSLAAIAEQPTIGKLKINYLCYLNAFPSHSSVQFHLLDLYV